MDLGNLVIIAPSKVLKGACLNPPVVLFCTCDHRRTAIGTRTGMGIWNRLHGFDDLEHRVDTHRHGHLEPE